MHISCLMGVSMWLWNRKEAFWSETNLCSCTSRTKSNNVLMLKRCSIRPGDTIRLAGAYQHLQSLLITMTKLIYLSHTKKGGESITLLPAFMLSWLSPGLSETWFSLKCSFPQKIFPLHVLFSQSSCLTIIPRPVNTIKIKQLCEQPLSKSCFCLLERVCSVNCS